MADQKQLRYRLVMIVVLAFCLHGAGARVLARTPHLCDGKCDSSTACSTECYLSEIDFENDNPTTCGDYGVCLPPCTAVCNAVADAGAACADQYEEPSTCEDYGVYRQCGDGVCVYPLETCDTCSDDCGECPPPPVCGENGCELGENCMNCAEDCGSCSPVNDCNNNGKCEPGESKSCPDCQKTGFCSTDSDCPTFNSSYSYTCVNDACLLSDLPSWAQTCPNGASDCTGSGMTCVSMASLGGIIYSSPYCGYAGYDCSSICVHVG